MLCGKNGKWKTKLEEPPQPNQVVTLLSLGDVKHDVLNYLHTHPNIQIEVPPNITKREKGLKVKVKSKERGPTLRQVIKELASMNIEAIEHSVLSKMLQRILITNPLLKHY